jgi:hypothetical protein
VTVLSPEISAREQLRATTVATADGQLCPPEELLPVLIRLRCLDAARDGLQSVTDAFEAAAGAELQGALGLSELWKRRGLWFGYTSFVGTLLGETGDDERSLNYSRYVLSQLSVEELFEQSSSWQSLSRKVQRETLSRLVSEQSQFSQLSEMLFEAYRRQRSKTLRQMALRTFPTLVLMVSTLIAVVMAIFVWRSLFIGN